MTVIKKDIPGFPGYQATSDGRIWSKKRNIFLKSRLEKAGYVQVGLSVNNRSVMRRAHVLISSAFFGPREKGFNVDHINNIRSDNRVSNLRYLTIRDNLLRRACKMTPELVKELRAMSQSGVTTKDLALTFNIHPCSITRIIRGERWGWV
jgi:hypothetical protein